jgi:class 3 adenylate cyclase
VAKDFPFPVVNDPNDLGTLQMWDRDVYADLLACREGRMSGAAFDAKYRYTAAIMALDMTGFTRSSMRQGDLASLLRIVDVHRVCLPVFREFRTAQVRAFADDLSATFDDPGRALACAFELHRRVGAYNALLPPGGNPAQVCIGLGYGGVYRLGPDRAMGKEMNQASKLGEDIAQGGETLVTEGFRAAVATVPGCRFTPRTHEEAKFPYFQAFCDE